MRSNNVLHQLVERRCLPVSTRGAGDLRFLDLAQDRLRLDTFRPASVFKWLLSAAALIQTVFFQNTSRIQRMSGQIGQSHSSGHRTPLPLLFHLGTEWPRGAVTPVTRRAN